MNDEFDDTAPPDLTDDEQALLDEMPAVTDLGLTRRGFLAGSLGVFALELLATEEALAALVPAPDAATAKTTAAENLVKVAFEVNGATKTLELDSRVVLLDALRERLELTGSKKGCDQGQCGACTVIVDGRRVLSCLTLTASVEGKEVTTVEGLAKAISSIRCRRPSSSTTVGTADCVRCSAIRTRSEQTSFRSDCGWNAAMNVEGRDGRP